MTAPLAWSDTIDGATFHPTAVTVIPGVTRDVCPCGELHPILAVRLLGHWEGGATDTVDVILPAASAQSLAGMLTAAQPHAAAVLRQAQNEGR